ncbi:ubl carboxyl-terminal hydrolase 18-like isoform X2 [Scyliorhinus canicula]|uniref:ubl carboxyl-terminal hydrolase 18-like isoform X2 n=1 Tax=Scyliorhinus canicula TaxID=7830 RepID=UPI0018F27D08|nr:ubl carboxyl-terminal hydrolase 18-like isoform X2 [Scyliorhinus canicula]XP_038672884.1 ubl carboxyl-terminal hydrolase 18-like isoform X2 [Scyliorhinus canicula]
MSRGHLSCPAPGRTTNQSPRFVDGSSRDVSREDYQKREQTPTWTTTSSYVSQETSPGFSNRSHSTTRDYAPSVPSHPGNTETSQSDYTNQVQRNRLNDENIQYVSHSLSRMDISERKPSSINLVKTNEPNVQIISDIPKIPPRMLDTTFKRSGRGHIDGRGLPRGAQTGDTRQTDEEVESDYTNQVQRNRLNDENIQYVSHSLSRMDISERKPSSINLVKTNEPNMQIISDIPKERQTEARPNSSELPACVPECSGNERNIVDCCEQRTSTIYCGDQMFVGLTNTGNNCCLNALLQTLFVTQNYAALLLDCRQKGVLKKAEDSIPYHLYKLFKYRRNNKRPVPTHRFIQCLKLNRFNVGIQLDAEELFRSFFHLLQDQLKETGFIEAVNNLHMVTIGECNRCLKCDHEFTQVGYMLTIPLSLYNASGNTYETIVNSLHGFFKHQLLDDDNKCHCDKCGEKTATTQYCRLLSCPQILCLQLKRFDLDPRWGTVVKNYDLMKFQEDLDLESFIGIHHSQKNKWQYKLLSVIVHEGSGTFGHYYAYVRNVQEMDWYYMNDEIVQRATWKDVENTFGSSSSSARLWRQTAYLLFYKRMD